MRKLLLSVVAALILLVPVRAFANGPAISGTYEAYVDVEEGILDDEGNLVPYGAVIELSEMYGYLGIPDDICFTYEGKTGHVNAEDILPCEFDVAKEYEKEDRKWYFEKYEDNVTYSLFRDAKVFEGPSPNYPVCGQIEEGTSVHPLYRYGDLMVYVELEGVKGWICTYAGMEEMGGGLVTAVDEYANLVNAKAVLKPCGEGESLIAGPEDKLHIVGESCKWNASGWYLLVDIGGVKYEYAYNWHNSHLDNERYFSYEENYQYITIVDPSECFDSVDLSHKVTVPCTSEQKIEVAYWLVDEVGFPVVILDGQEYIVNFENYRSANPVEEEDRLAKEEVPDVIEEDNKIEEDSKIEENIKTVSTAPAAEDKSPDENESYEPFDDDLPAPLSGKNCTMLMVGLGIGLIALLAVILLIKNNKRNN